VSLKRLKQSSRPLNKRLTTSVPPKKTPRRASGAFSYCQTVCKPGSVKIGHLSRPVVAERLERYIFGLAGTNEALISCPNEAHSLQQTGFTSDVRHRTSLWAFTPLVSPLPLVRGSFVSVALSLGLPPVAVSDCHSLCCPDFPRATSTQPINNLTLVLYHYYYRLSF